VQEACGDTVEPLSGRNRKQLTDRDLAAQEEMTALSLLGQRAPYPPLKRAVAPCGVGTSRDADRVELRAGDRLLGEGVDQGSQRC
jgi:hypothetical protein